MKFINTHQQRILSFLLFLILYLLYFQTIDFTTLSNGYKITSLLPLVFIVVYYMFLWFPTIKIKSPFFVMYTLIAFARFVVLSIVTIENGNYNGISGIPVLDSNLTFAGILMIWELIITAIFINYWSHKHFKTSKLMNKYYYSSSNKNFYILFFLFSVSLIFIFPETRNGISFFGNISYAQNDQFSSFITLGIREMFINAKYFLLFAIIIVLQRKNGINFKKNKLLSYLIIICFVLVIISIRVGSNRKKLMADAIAALLLLWHLFPNYKKTTAFSIAVLGISLVVATTVYRGMTSSFSSFFDEYFNLEILQTYLLGQYNIGISIEAKEIFSNHINIKNFVLSLLRPLFGVGSLIKSNNNIYLENLFDARMSMGIEGFRGDQILPLIGEGYMYFGFLFSPLFSIIFVRLGVFFDKLYFRTDNIEVLFLSIIISFYLAQAMILNSTILINMLSFRLAIYLPVYWLGKSMEKKKGDYLFESSY